MFRIIAFALTPFIVAQVANAEDLSVAQWTSFEEVDGFTDQRNVFAGVKSKDGKGLIFLLCNGAGEKNSFEAKISTGNYIGDRNFHGVANVKYRVDKQEAVERSFKGSSHFRYFNDPNDQMLSDLAFGSTLLVEIRAYDASASRSEFSLNGSKAAIKDVVESCGGKMPDGDVAKERVDL